MNSIYILIVIFISVVFMDCSPKVTTKLYNPSLSREYYKYDVAVLGINDEVPVKAQELGIIKIKDKGFFRNCTYNEVIAIAKAEVKKAGGNTLKIIEHRSPDPNNGCHRIKGKIYKCDSTQMTDSLWRTNATRKIPDKETIVKKSDRNAKAFGYQLGGYSLLGFEYEIRFHDYFGVNIGGGFRGYTGGLKIHTNARKNSSFFLVSYKNGGFNLIHTLGVDYGAKWIFIRKANLGLLFQLGLAKVLYMDNAFATYVYGRIPSAVFTIGAGLTW